MMSRAIMITLAAAALSGAARAETAAPRLTGLMSPRPVAARPLDLSGPHAAPRFTDPQTDAQRAAGLARTSLDRRFGPDATVGAVGFLCGREPGHTDSGSAAAFGSDPHGRFLGAKLTRAF